MGFFMNANPQTADGFKDRLITNGFKLIEDPSRISGYRVSCNKCANSCTNCHQNALLCQMQREYDMSPHLRGEVQGTHVVQFFLTMVLILIAIGLSTFHIGLCAG